MGPRRSAEAFAPPRAFALRSIAVATMACVSLAAQEPVLLRDPKTKDLFASARIAIFGGPGGIARLRAMRFKGRSRFPASDGTLISANTEIRILLPDAISGSIRVRSADG